MYVIEICVIWYGRMSKQLEKEEGEKSDIHALHVDSEEELGLGTKRGCESLFANLPTQVGWAVSSEAKQMKAMFETVPKLHLILRNFTSTSVVSAVPVPLHLDSMGLCE